MSDTSERKRKTPIWVWVVGGIVALGLVGNLFGGGDESDEETASVESETSEPLSGGSDSDEAEAPEPVEPEPEATLSPSEAFCSDLESGLSVFQIFEGGLDGGSYDSIEEFADLAYGYAAVSCPDTLQEDEGLRGFLEEWGINPDAGPTAPDEPELSAEESACLDAWKAEKAAVDAGTLDDATLVATAYDCPDLETWEEMRAQVNYGTSPNLITAVCAIEPDSPVCRDANS